MSAPPNDEVILAIDLGTSGPKVGLVNTRGVVLAHEFESTPVSLLPGGGAEQDPGDWWSAIRTAIHRLLGRNVTPREKIAALSCTAQWSGTVPVDREGQHIQNAIIWMDSRGAPYVTEITRSLVRIGGYGLWKSLKWLRLTGGVPTRAGKDPIAHILFLKNERPDTYAAAHKFLEPKDYINLRLTGNSAASYDSIALYWLTDNRDLKNVRYDPWLVRKSAVDPGKLPLLKRAVDVLGPIRDEVAEELDLPRSTPVIVGTPDLHSTGIGAGAVEDYQVHLYLGTSSWINCHVPFRKTDIRHNMASLPSALPDRYLVANTQESAGGCLDHLGRLLYGGDLLPTGSGHPDVYERLNRLAAGSPPGSEKLIFTPWLCGERTPVEDHTVRGGFFNQSLRTSRAHVARAVFEGVAYNSKWLLGYVERFIARRIEAISVVGGGAESDLWCQIHADVLNLAVRQVRDPVLANVRGAAFLAAVALGRLAVSDIPSLVEISRTYRPEPDNRAVYDELFREYLNLYRHNKKIYRRLNRLK